MDSVSIHSKIYEVRGLRVMLDYDLSDLYEVETRALKQAVRRNKDRFPEDFMIQLTVEEVQVMVSQFVIPSKQQYNRQFADVYDALNYLMNDKQTREALETRKLIGFKPLKT